MDLELPIIDNRLSIRAKPNSKKTDLKKVEENIAFIDIAAPPEDDKANIELLKFLRRRTGRSCRILTGATSKRKIVIFE